MKVVKKTIHFEGGRYYRKAIYINKDGVRIECFVNYVSGGACQKSNIKLWTGHVLDVHTEEIEFEEYPRKKILSSTNK